jgi:outer membrane protein assembly factor BamB
MTAPYIPLPTRKAAGHRLWFPITVALVVVAANLVPVAWHAADLDPAPLIQILTVATMLIPLGALLILVWLVGFSRYRWRTRLAVIGLLVAAGAGAAACIRTVEFTGSFGMIPVWRWQQTGAERFAAYRAQETRSPDGLPAIDLAIDPGRDFPRYRGVNADGALTGRNLAGDWSGRGPTQVWKHPCGGGYAGFAAAGNVLVTAEQRGGNEAVVCYDQATGRERWAYEYPALFHQSEPMGGDGPRATPTIADGDVYSLGATGELVCLDGATGSPRWKANILTDSSAKNLQWGMAGSPLVLGDLVVVNPGIDPANNARQAVAAYDRKTGQRRWAAGEHLAGYSSPQRARLLGVEQVVLFDAGGLAGVDPATGRELWRFPWKSMMDMNIVQPLVIGEDRLYISSQVSEGGAMVRVRRAGDGWAAEEVWRNRFLCSAFSNPVAHNGHIYGLSNTPNPLVCLDQETGQRRWREGRFGSGQVLVVDGRLLVFGEAGELVLVDTDPAGYRERGRAKVSEHRKNWNTPTLVGRRLYLRNHTDMACYELPAADATARRGG